MINRVHSGVTLQTKNLNFDLRVTDHLYRFHNEGSRNS